MGSSFDQFSKNYEDKVAEATRLFGEGHDYFTRLKVKYLDRFLNTVFKGRVTTLNVLDAGCGTGGLQNYLKTLKFQYKSFGIDTSIESLKTALERNPDVYFTNASSAKLPFKDSQFDVVCFAVVVHHIPLELRLDTYREVLRILKPGGVIAVFEHNPFNPLTQYIVRTCELDDDAVLVSMPKLRKDLISSGFEIGRSQYTTFFPKSLGFLRELEERIGWFPMGGQYYIMAQKPRKHG